MDYINIHVIADRIKRNPLLEDIPFETIIDYGVEFIKIMGIPASFVDKTAFIQVTDYIGQLPCDFYSPIQFRTNKGDYFRYSNDTFHMSKFITSNKGVTYKLQGNCIITSIPECTIELAYRAFPMNEEGYPLIPDNGSYPRALQEYIIVECYTTLFDQGKISQQVLFNHQQRYSFYAGQAKNDLIMPTLDQMESLSNMWNRFLPSKKAHSNGFESLGAKETIKIH
jgi:hypothetical protein